MNSGFSNQKIVDQFIEECIKPMFPNCSVVSSGSGLVPGNMKNPPIRDLQFNTNNKHYVGSRYSFNRTHKFLHYTSLKGLFGILDSKELRMYNLRQMDDPNEVSYVLDALNLTSKSEYTTSLVKDGYYCLSMVEPKVEKFENSLDLWRRYGDDGRGVAIEIEFPKSHVKYWTQYHLSRVHYGDSGLIELRDWLDKCIQFMKANRLNLENLDSAMRIAKACHKREIYRLEKEVRLIYSLRRLLHVSDYKIVEMKQNDSNIHFDLSGSRKPTDYHTLEIESERWKNYTQLKGIEVTKKEAIRNYPQVKIKSVVFGYRIPHHEAGELCQFIHENLDKKVRFYDSPLRRYFTTEFNEKQFYGYKDPTHKSKPTEQ